MDGFAKGKVLVMGPKKSGKTRVANFLSGHEEQPDFSSAYKPTKGTRILEFEESVQSGKGRGVQLNVELWDCSGDEQYNNCCMRHTRACLVLSTHDEATLLAFSRASPLLMPPSLPPLFCPPGPAILRDVSGVVLVYDPSTKEQEKDIETWYKSFVARLGLKDEQVLLFAHQAQATSRSAYQAPRNLDRFRFLNTTLDSEESTQAMRQTFSQFLSAVAAAVMDKSNADMDESLALASR